MLAVFYHLEVQVGTACGSRAARSSDNFALFHALSVFYTYPAEMCVDGGEACAMTDPNDFTVAGSLSCNDYHAVGRGPHRVAPFGIEVNPLMASAPPATERGGYHGTPWQGRGKINLLYIAQFGQFTGRYRTPVMSLGVPGYGHGDAGMKGIGLKIQGAHF